MRAHAGARALLILFFLTCLLTTLCSASAADSTDSRFLAGLRERRLYSLAERYCRDRLKDTQLSPVDRAELTIELARVLAGQALDAPAETRNDLWQSAHDSLADFVAADPQNPRLLLIRLQDALVQLAHGEQVRQEAELTAQPATAEAAQRLLRGAVVLLEGIADDAQAQRPAASSGDTPPGTLTAEELAALEKRVAYQRARALHSEALAWPEGSEERSYSLVTALETLEPLVSRQTADDLFWQSRLEQVTCLRLLNRRAEAAAAISHLQQYELSPQLALRLRAEEILLALSEAGAPEVQTYLEQGRTLDGQSLAELDLAHLQACLQLADQARDRHDDTAAERWQNQAAQLLAVIQRDYNAYDQQRAEAMIASAGGQNSASLELLSATAATAYRQGDFTRAVETYQLASQRAAQAGDNRRAFDFAYTAAAILHERGQLAEARDQFAATARNWPTQPRAAEAHLAAAYDASQIVRTEGDAGLENYLALLQEHLDLWPDSSTASQAAWWLARIRQYQSQWGEARAAYARVRPGFEHYPAALVGLETSWKNEIEALRAGSGDYRGEANRAAHFFEQRVLGPQGQVPTEWTPTARTAALSAARIRLAFLPDTFSTAEQLLTAAIVGQPEPPPDWRAEAQALRVVALAGLGRRDEADAALGQITGGSPERLLEALESLSTLTEGADAEVGQELARLELRTIALLRQENVSLTPTQRADLARIEAEALADAGRRDEALEHYRQLAADRPDDGRIQQGYAELLAAGNDPSSLEQALDQWRRVLARSPELSDRWWQARYQIAELHFRLGEPQRAAEIIQLLAALHPELGGPALKAKFDALLAQCQ